MKLVITKTAEKQIRLQIDYLIEQHAPEAAERLRAQIYDFLHSFVLTWPRAANRLDKPDSYSVPVPRTPYVLYYRIKDDDTIVVRALFHGRQMRETKR